MVLRAVTRYRIVTSGMPRVAAADPFAGQPQAAYYAMHFDRFARVLRTGRCVAAIVTEERTQQVAVSLNK